MLQAILLQHTIHPPSVIHGLLVFGPLALPTHLMPLAQLILVQQTLLTDYRFVAQVLLDLFLLMPL